MIAFAADPVRRLDPVPRHGRTAAHPRRGRGHRGRPRLGALVSGGTAGARPSQRSATSPTRSTCGTGRWSSSSPSRCPATSRNPEKLAGRRGRPRRGRAHQAVRRGPGAALAGPRGQPPPQLRDPRGERPRLGSAGPGRHPAVRVAAAASSRRSRPSSTSSDCVGAEATAQPRCTSIEGDELLSSPAVARADKPVLYDQGCWSNRPFTAHPVCTFGDPDGDVQGGTHRQLARGPLAARRWRDRRRPRVAAGHLPGLAVLHRRPRPGVRVGPGHPNCRAWNRWAVGKVSSGDYDLVVMSDRTFQQIVGVQARTRRPSPSGPTPTPCAPITASGTPVLVLRDVPSASVEVPGLRGRAPRRRRRLRQPRRSWPSRPTPSYAAAAGGHLGLVAASTSPTGSAATGGATSSSVASSPTSTTAT